MTSSRPAFYALEPGGWRDYVTLLHPPYTLWHLSFVAVGAGLAPEVQPTRLALVLTAFLLAMGVGAHALDELQGRPLRTRIGSGMLVALAAASIGGAIAIGVVAALLWSLWLLAFVAAGGFLVVAYNLELAGGLFHGDPWFSLGWGAFPVLTAYFLCAGRIRAEAVAAAAFAALLSHAQRVLSTQVRTARRRTASVEGRIVYVDGSEERLDQDTLTRMPEAALKTLAAASVAIGIALLLLHAR